MAMALRCLDRGQEASPVLQLDTEELAVVFVRTRRNVYTIHY